ncbi:methyl-accepting chemotaxis protein [[Acidovorax] ebreus]|uniref:Methyl-accepting chemotaxis sensory transducer with Cache sensor n=1 Tax=Acidovorax ebreus (strain TPSY) TaxID=535289 RepID=A0A9J9Q9W7_ACIET|nr:cache domain-containing protein [[Acidovorax] ebreus]ACM31837.1 methyl-accepting chemotaxis sensory transducer with Cache sensor [[Acidovorax] ebreus TPSY]
MQMFYRLPVSRRLGGLVALAILAMLALVASIMWTERSLIMGERQASVRQTVEAAHGIVVHFHAQASKGTITEEEAKQRAMDALRPLRYSGSEYFWINDMHPRMVMHPIRPELQGQDLSSNKDPTGKHLFVEFVNTVKRSGAGFVSYLWPKPGSDQPVEKASYVMGFEPWGWVIGSGVYVDNVQATFVSRLARSGAVTAVLALLLLAIGWLVARSILRQLGAEPSQLNAITHEMAQGNLAVEIPPARDSDSVIHGIQTMRDNVAEIVQGVRRSSEHVATASAEISQGNHDLSGRTESQASALEETAASMEQLGATVRQNADNARQANQLAMNASTVAVQGGEVVSEVVDTMRGINESSRKIADIIGVIDGIAFQTNILALNAAVEAAKEIKQLITASVERVEQGSQLVDKAGATMTEVVTAIRRVTDIMGEISAASSEQSSGVAQVGEAITQMDQATQQNAALVEEMAAAASSLSGQARELVEAVAVFKLAQKVSALPRMAPVHAPAVPAPVPATSATPAAPARPATPPASTRAPAAALARPAAARPQPAQAARTAADNDEWESF